MVILSPRSAKQSINRFLNLSAVRGPMFRETANRDVTGTLIGGGGVYSYIHVLPDEFLFKSNSNSSLLKETRRAEHEYVNIHTPN